MLLFMMMLNTFSSYLHGKVVNEAQPASGMFKKNIETLLKSFTTSMMEHVFCFESLVNWQRDWVIRIFDCKLGNVKS